MTDLNAIDWNKNLMLKANEVYFLNASTEDGVNLLKASSLKGFIYPATDGWTTLFPQCPKYKLNCDLIKNNKFVMVHFISDKGAGWRFEIFDKQENICTYASLRGDEFFSNDGNFNENNVLRLLKLDAEKIENIKSALYKKTKRIQSGYLHSNGRINIFRLFIIEFLSKYKKPCPINKDIIIV